MKILAPLFICVLFFSTSFAKLPEVSKGEPLPSDLFVELAKLINPTVVNINTSQIPKFRKGLRNDPYAQFLKQFFGPQVFNQQQAPQAHSLGTGFIIRKDGLILTNNHVIDGADIIKVQLSENDEKLYDAKVIGKDKRTDIALIKIETKVDLPVAKLGESKSLEVGEWLAAFGNPYGHGHTMTKGILSARGRNINELNKFSFLQTDASINPGNSGGPLVNVHGEVVGVNTAIDARAQGIGFAIPIDDVKKILTILEKSGHVKRGYAGVSLSNISPQMAHSLKLKSTSGALVTQIIESSPAETAGIKPYDVFLEFDGKKVSNAHNLSQYISDADLNKTYAFKINRNGKVKGLKIKILVHPDDKLAQRKKKKSYKGQKAPFNIGFKVINYNRALAKTWNLPRLRAPRPVVIEVTPGSAAEKSGLIPGDIILDINRMKTAKARQVLRSLKKDGFNLIRVLRGNRVLLLQVMT